MCNFSVDEDEAKILTLEPLVNSTPAPHDTVFINELKLSEFKQVLLKGNINSEFSGGVLWCSNGTIAVRRVCYKVCTKDCYIDFVLFFRLIMEKLLSKDAYLKIIIRLGNFYINNTLYCKL